MKKISIILTGFLILFFVASSGFAQNTKKFRFGLKGCPTLTWLKPDTKISDSQAAAFAALGLETKEYTSEGMIFGFSYGFIGEFTLADNYSFVTGIDITYNGGKLKYPHKQNINDTIPTFGTMNRKYVVKYIEIPIMLKMKTNEIGYITYFGQFGFGTSVNISAKAKDEYEYKTTGDNETVTNEDVDIKNDIRFLKESLIIGLGIEYSLGGTTSVIAGINFNNGFTNILKGKNDIIKPEIEEKAISNYLEINIGILF